MLNSRHHIQSLEGMEEKLLAALGSLFPVTIGGRRIELADVVVDERSCWRGPDGATWGREAEIHLIAADGKEFFADIASVLLPWTLSPEADESPSLVDGMLTGGHDLLFASRPLIPLAHLATRPGLHRIFRPSGEPPRFHLVPDVGPVVVFEARLAGLGVGIDGDSPVEFQLAQDGTPLHTNFDEPDYLPDARQRRRRALRNHQNARLTEMFIPTTSIAPIVLTESTIALVNRVLGLSSAQLGPEHLKGMKDLLDAIRRKGSTPLTAIDELSQEQLVPLAYGEILVREVTSAVHHQLRQLAAMFHHASSTARPRRRAETWGEMEPKDQLQLVSRRVQTAADRAVTRLLRGRTLGGALVIGDDDRNTLAAAERRREVTRFGPGAPIDKSHTGIRSRGIHPDRRGRLCPLQTPETPDLGFIRYLASGGSLSEGDLLAENGNEWADLSAAAALIPFINHDDPARSSIGAKNLKQAVPIVGRTAPRVRTGMEYELANKFGVCRAPQSGNVRRLEHGLVQIGDSGTLVRFGPSLPSSTKVDSGWIVAVADGAWIESGEILAHAPDVILEDGVPQLALGRDCLVALTPWNGWNFEDGIVVSEALVDEFASSHFVRFTEPVDARAGEWVEFRCDIAEFIEEGSVIAAVVESTFGGRRELRTILAPATGELVQFDLEPGLVRIAMRVRCRLQVGDKLTNRHGGKGVVSRIVPVEEMPRMPDGTPIEVILNPLGVLRRLNIGQLYETHTSLLAYLGNAGPTTVGRIANIDALRGGLQERGAANGQVCLSHPDGRVIGERVTVGWQQIIKLDHLAVTKERSRHAGARSIRDVQPAKGTTWSGGQQIGGAQRLGEMEFWALQAWEAGPLLEDSLRRAGDRGATFASVRAHLRVGGVLISGPIDKRRYQLVLDEPELQDIDDANIEQRTLRDLIDLPKKVRGLDQSEGDDPLHDPTLHGEYGHAAVCACGLAHSKGTLCTVCGTKAQRWPDGHRRTFRYKITLAVPVPHPWYERLGDDAPMITSIPLLPPAYRSRHHDLLDQAYRSLIHANRLATLRADLDSPGEEMLKPYVEDLLGTMFDISERGTVAARLQTKTGLLRRGLRGRNTDIAGRSVIVPEPDRDPSTVGLPIEMYRRLQITPATRKVSSDIVIVNRQPTLHPYNLIALHAEPVEGSAIRIHPILCAALAGDFDGDEVTVHRPRSEPAQRTARQRLEPSARIRSTANGKVITKGDLDVALGLYLLGVQPDGRATLSTSLNLADNIWQELGSTQGPIRPSVQQLLAVRCVESAAEPTIALARLATLFEIGVRVATGWSISALDMPAGSSPDDIDASSPLGQAIAAGVAGKLGGQSQLLLARGSHTGFDGKEASPIANSFLKGLGSDEYFSTAPAALRTLSEKKLVSPLAGGLTKCLVEACYDVIVECEDCGASAPRSPLTCLVPTDNICAACFGPDPATGISFGVGHRIGIWSAMVVGERSTQEAMKAFHSGGSGAAVGGRVHALRSAFGYERFPTEIPEEVGPRPAAERLADVRSMVDSNKLGLRDALEPVIALVDHALGHEVVSSHIEVVLRRHWRAEGDSRNVGEPLTDATTQGSMRPILNAALLDLEVDATTSAKGTVIELDNEEETQP